MIYMFKEYDAVYFDDGEAAVGELLTDYHRNSIIKLSVRGRIS